jgi:hypothetical protein
MPRSKEKGAKAGAGSASSAGAQKSGHHQKGKTSPEATASQGPSKASGTSPKGSIVESLHSLTHRPKAPASPPATNVEEGHVALEAKSSVVVDVLRTSGTKSTQEQDDESKYESEDDSSESQRSDPKDKSYHGSKGSGSVHDRETRASRNSSTTSLQEQHGIGGIKAASRSMPSIRTFVTSSDTSYDQIERSRTVTSTASISGQSGRSDATLPPQGPRNYNTLRAFLRPIKPGRGSEYQPRWDAHEKTLLDSISRIIRDDDIKIAQETLDAILSLGPAEAREFRDVKATAPPEYLRGTISAADLHILQFILGENKVCERTRALEAGWNAQVHSNLMRLAVLSSTCEVNMHNVTANMKVKKHMRPEWQGNPQVAEAVDFVFTLPVDVGNHEATLIHLMPGESKHLYNSFRCAITDRQFAVMFVETKRALEDNGNRIHGSFQNAVAVDAQIRWLHELMQLAKYCSGKGFRAPEGTSQLTQATIPALPSLLIVGSKWYVQLSKQEDLGGFKTLYYELNDGKALADTETLLGIFKVLEIQFALLKYIEERYEPWLKTFLQSLPGGDFLAGMPQWADVRDSNLSPITESHE